ncbi:MAG: DNA mismatch repair endonuclease MutL [bacterium]
MPNRIHLLNETVANQIAAGEVIERPAAVVKEFMENALDAGADRIDVEAQRGGKSLVRVTDNGWGMSYDDALLALERHATSKIRQSEDLLAIQSYGFRGEAIPSIASVCRFRLVTREKEAVAGTEIVIDGGKIVKVSEAGCAVGTMAEARSLFFNLPARRKFLRTEQTEWAHIEQWLRLAALTRPRLHLTVRHNNREVFLYPAVETLEERLLTVFGKKWVEDMLPLEAQGNGMTLRGMIGKAGVSRANRQEQFLFVNNRPVQNATLNFALMEGYHNALMKGRYPVAALFLEMDARQVDVNVHPAKREVRFRDPNNVRQFVAEAVADVLRTARPSSSVSFLSHPAPTASAAFEARGFISKPPVSYHAETLPMPHETRAESKNHDLRIVGVILNLYIVAEGKQGLVLIDQHAAHERILFEQMLDRVAKEEVLSQSLLLPCAVELPPDQAVFLKEQLAALQRIGVGVSELGGNTFMVDALPPMIKTQAVEDFFRSMLVDLQEAGGETRRKRKLSEEEIAKTVCRHAVKANDSLKLGEIEKLLSDLHACELPHTCPHGRPTMTLISRAELEKRFGRLVA